MHVLVHRYISTEPEDNTARTWLYQCSVYFIPYQKHSIHYGLSIIGKNGQKHVVNKSLNNDFPPTSIFIA